MKPASIMTASRFSPHNLCIAILLALATLTFSSGEESSQEQKTARQGRVFSLFSIVSFTNVECLTTSSLSGGSTTSRVGSCYTQSECQNMGGRTSGVCAAGFGVCCLFLTEECGATVVQNNTYVRNPGFPDEYDEETDCSYNVRKMSPDVCSLRLDFESFTLAGPAVTNVAEPTNHEPFGGICDQDIFSVSATDNGGIPHICGINQGQHIYVDLGTGDDGAAVLQFEFPNPYNLNLDRDWEIKIAQIPCGANYSPPPGCLQYFTGLSGRFETFNYESTDTPHLGEQRYSACIRKEKGFCCNQYKPCPEDSDAFTLDTKEADPKAYTEENCEGDYVRIEGGSNTCQRIPTFTVNKYCGTLFSSTNEAEGAQDVVCDCSTPFSIDVFTDGFGDNIDDGEDATNEAFSRGACLEWTQVPC